MTTVANQTDVALVDSNLSFCWRGPDSISELVDLIDVVLGELVLPNQVLSHIAPGV